ncbi:tat protein secretion system quality control protein TatD [endosymbiont of Sipalinus gigas]|uniref:TatD family hydrolase n=1 Tax=endosymbiont of Sipalinus gigas TaxID=1972134 RepID=UPI000DC7242F|nr:TatD family hydrolase [endosymbiont of Sipalinus gigas]BBA85365.1 tat protein secretion system quality control protein TatD [endosymbiont of Sipalinus gigas]
MKNINLIDSHCHINDILTNYSIYNNIDDFINDSLKNNVNILLNVSITISDFKESYLKFKKIKNILYSCGIHPLHINNTNLNKDIKELSEISLNKDVIAIGETGLDFLKEYNKVKKNIQINSFTKHIEISKNVNKPIIIHTRNSSEYIIDIIKNEKINGVIHSFNDELYILKKFLDENLYISLSGILTFKNSNLKNIIKYIPINKLLIETDSPYLSPHPYRGKCNIPSNINEIINYISKCLNLDVIYLSENIYNNFINFLNYK